MITQERLKELFDYDLSTGEFKYRKYQGHGARMNIGVTAGTINQKGYRMIWIDRKPYQAHRLAWLYIYNEWPADWIDHINRVRHDNRIANLRLASGTISRVNSVISNRNTSGFRGVTLHKPTGKWQAQLNSEGKNYYLGLFSSIKEASEAYKAKFAELYPSVNTEMEINMDDLLTQSTGNSVDNNPSEVQEALSRRYSIAAIVTPLESGKFAVFSNDRSLDSLIICQPEDLPFVIASRAKMTPRKTPELERSPRSQSYTADFSDL